MRRRRKLDPHRIAITLMFLVILCELALVGYLQWKIARDVDGIYQVYALEEKILDKWMAEEGHPDPSMKSPLWKFK